MPTSNASTPAPRAVSGSALCLAMMSLELCVRSLRAAIVLTISDVRFDVCEAVSWMPMGHVRIIIRNLHPQFMRKGATAILLAEGGV